MSEIRPARELAPRRRVPARDFVNSTAFEWLSRAGFVARAAIYAIIGVLAFKLAIGSGGKLTNQQGALSTVAHQPFGSLPAHAARDRPRRATRLWRLVPRRPRARARGLGLRLRTPRGTRAAVSRTARCACSPSRSCSGPARAAARSPKSSAAGVLGWPGGTWIVGAVGLVMIGVALYQAYKGITQKFLEDSKTEEMSPGVRNVDRTRRNGRPSRAQRSSSA